MTALAVGCLAGSFLAAFAAFYALGRCERERNLAKTYRDTAKIYRDTAATFADIADANVDKTRTLIEAMIKVIVEEDAMAWFNVEITEVGVVDGKLSGEER